MPVDKPPSPQFPLFLQAALFAVLGMYNVILHYWMRRKDTEIDDLRKRDDDFAKSEDINDKFKKLHEDHKEMRSGMTSVQDKETCKLIRMSFQKDLQTVDDRIDKYHTENKQHHEKLETFITDLLKEQRGMNQTLTKVAVTLDQQQQNRG